MTSNGHFKISVLFASFAALGPVGHSFLRNYFTVALDMNTYTRYVRGTLCVCTHIYGAMIIILLPLLCIYGGNKVIIVVPVTSDIFRQKS